MFKVSLIIPTYNEAKNLPLLFEEIWNILDKNQIDLEFIVVDDNSPDDTGQAAEDLKNKYPIKVIHRSGKLGLGSAVIEGFKLSDRPYLGVMDADLSHDPAILNELILSLAENDVALGSRFQVGSEVEKWVWWRKLTSQAGVFMARILTGVNDPLSGYFFIKREVVENIDLNTTGYKLLLEILVKGKWKEAKEVPYHFRMRQYSQSKLNYKEYFLFAGQIIRYGLLKLYYFLKNTFVKNKIFTLVAFLFFILVLTVSRTQSVWLDESLSIAFSRESIRDIINLSMTADLHPPLYYLFLHFIDYICTGSIFLIRFWSGLFYLLSAIFLYRYLTYKKLFADKITSVLFAFLLFLSPFAVFYASEARSYSLTILICLLQFICFDKILDNFELKKNFICYTFFSIIGIYLFYPVIFLLIGEFVYVIILKRGFLKKLFWPWLIVLLSYLPWIYLVIVRRMAEMPGHFLAIPWWQIPAVIFVGFSGGRVSITDLNHIHQYWPTILIALAYLINFFGILYWWKTKENRDYLLRLAVPFFVVLFICLAISATRFSIFDPRYYTELFPLFILGLIYSAFYLNQKLTKIKNLFIIFLIIANLIFLGLYLFNPWYAREPWKSVVPVLESEYRAGDAIVFIGYHQPPPAYSFYQTIPEYIVSTYPDNVKNTEDYFVIEKNLNDNIKYSKRIWYSQFLEWQKDPEQKIRKMLERKYTYIKTVGFFKVQFDLYERK
jgi:glycosyltransferase involved in cell wall biosynthesis